MSPHIVLDKISDMSCFIETPYSAVHLSSRKIIQNMPESKRTGGTDSHPRYFAKSKDSVQSNVSNLTRTWIENSIKTEVFGGPEPNANRNSATNVEPQRELNRYATFPLPVRNEVVMQQSRHWSFYRLAQFFCSLAKSHRSTHKAQPFSLSTASLSSQ